MTRFCLKTIPLVLTLFAANVAMGQTGPCNLKLADLPQPPELMGFKLGMTMDQVKARVPQVVFGRTDDLGKSKTTINPDFNAKIDKTSFQGVRSVSLDFLDARLTSLWLGYDSSFKWHTVDDFVKGISASLQLPNAWRSWKIRGQQLRCADFWMTVTIVAEGPSFRIVDQTAEDQLVARREAKEEQESEPAESGDDPKQIVADSGSKTYYGPDCPPAKPISAKDQVVFKSAQEAEKAGYKRAKNCSQ
ncbi:MAG: hypothetical protein ACRD6N_13590 [Pyrinomonadaceae bacterium]